MWRFAQFFIRKTRSRCYRHYSNEPRKNNNLETYLKEKFHQLPPTLKRFLLSKILISVSTGIILFFGGNTLYAGYIERNRIPRVVKQFRSGSNQLQLTNEKYFSRPQEEEEISQLIDPSNPGFFNLITGEHGTGKTTLIQHTCSQKQGVVYFDIPDDPKYFAKELGKCVDYDFEVNLSFWQQIRIPRHSPLELVLYGISSASHEYAKRYKRPAILFIDNFTMLAKKDKETFERIVRFAKKEADKHNLVVNFVSSEGHAPRQLKELSESSRLSKIIEIGDLDEQSALKYLNEYCEVNDEMAKGIYNIAGGRITLMKEASYLLNEGQDLEEIKAEFVLNAFQEFSDLLLPQDPAKVTDKQKEVWKQIMKIYDTPSKEISYYDFVKALSSQLVNELLQKNIFAYHPKRKTVSFQTRPVELLVESEIETPRSEKRKRVEKMINL